MLRFTKLFCITFLFLQVTASARYYDAEMGRFISRDPISSPKHPQAVMAQNNARQYGATGSFIQRDTGYHDGMSLYNGYFAEKMGLDPSGEEYSKAIEYISSDWITSKETTYKMKVTFRDNCKGKDTKIIAGLRNAMKTADWSRQHILDKDNKNLKKYFGNLSDEEKKKVQETYQKTFEALVFKTLLIDCCECKNKNSSTQAYILKTSSPAIVYLCPAFFKNKTNTEDMKTLLHEYNHVGAATGDHGYVTGKTGEGDNPGENYKDPKNPKRIITLSKEKLLDNADTYMKAAKPRTF